MPVHRQAQTWPSEHEQFDRLCSGIEEFEPLPSGVRRDAEPEMRSGEDSEDAALDGQILAGLVSPGY